MPDKFLFTINFLDASWTFPTTENIMSVGQGFDDDPETGNFVLPGHLPIS
jgi:hypothetical protein